MFIKEFKYKTIFLESINKTSLTFIIWQNYVESLRYKSPYINSIEEATRNSRRTPTTFRGRRKDNGTTEGRDNLLHKPKKLRHIKIRTGIHKLAITRLTQSWVELGMKLKKTPDHRKSLQIPNGPTYYQVKSSYNILPIHWRE